MFNISSSKGRAQFLSGKLQSSQMLLSCGTPLVCVPLYQFRVQYQYLNTLTLKKVVQLCPVCLSLACLPSSVTRGNCLHQFMIAYAGNAATANGAVALLDNMPSMDSTEVAQAKAQGAIILARGNMAEWAFTNAISIGSGPKMAPCNPCLVTLHTIVHYSVFTWNHAE